MLYEVITITVQKTTEEKVHWLAHFDPLTGLPNRTLLNDRVDYAIHIAEHNQSSLALLYVDLDHFKYINDTLGHHIGDEMLVQVASRIQSVLFEADTLSRQGGDEFMILLPSADRITSYNVCYTKLLRIGMGASEQQTGQNRCYRWQKRRNFDRNP